MESVIYSPDLQRILTALFKECAEQIHSNPPAHIRLNSSGILEFVVCVGDEYTKRFDSLPDMSTFKGRSMFVSQLKQKILLAHVSLNVTVRLKGTTDTGSYGDGRT